MSIIKNYKGITFTAIISLTLFTTSSSVKAATFITVDMGDSGFLTINSSNLTHNIVTRSQGQGTGILNAEEPIVINHSFNDNSVPHSTGDGTITINSSSVTITPTSPSVSIEGGSILNAGEAIGINNNTYNDNSVPRPTAGGTITISSSNVTITPAIPSVSIEGGSILNAGEAIGINNNTFNNNSVPRPTAGGTTTISSGTITATKIPEPASPISFAILGMGSFLLRLNKFREKKRV
jgi:hypothetical protein